MATTTPTIEVTTPMIICRFVLRPPLPPLEGAVDELVGFDGVIVGLAVGWTLVAWLAEGAAARPI